jgi:hypothetical protein
MKALAPITVPSTPGKLRVRALAALFPVVVDVLDAAEPLAEALAEALGELVEMGGGYVDPWAFISNVVLVYTCVRNEGMVQ